MSPKIRQTIYQLGTVVTGLLGIYLIWSGADASSGANVQGILEGILALFGSGATALAANVTGKQRIEGVLDPDPLKQILNGIQGVTEAKNEAENQYAKAHAVLAGLGQSGVTPFVPPSAFPNPAQAVTDIVAPIPVVGPLTSQLLTPFR
jgi:Mycobacterial 2 TMS Phage Holin (M2 Hol) Family